MKLFPHDGSIVPEQRVPAMSILLRPPFSPEKNTVNKDTRVYGGLYLTQFKETWTYFCIFFWVSIGYQTEIKGTQLHHTSSLFLISIFIWSRLPTFALFQSVFCLKLFLKLLYCLEVLRAKHPRSMPKGQKIMTIPKELPNLGNRPLVYYLVSLRR